jgi:hypothetical protein
MCGVTPVGAGLVHRRELSQAQGKFSGALKSCEKPSKTGNEEFASWRESLL